MADKTEKASPKKLRDAKRKGQVAKSQDLPSAFTFMASILITLQMSHWLFNHLAEFTTGLFGMIPRQDLLSVLPDLLGMESLMMIFILSIPVMGAVAIIGSVITFLSVGPVFAPEVFKFDIKKFNPVDNLKAKFKLKTIVELLKSCAKIGIATYIIYLVIYKSIPTLIRTVSLPITGVLTVFESFLMEVVFKVGLFFVGVALLDFLYQKHTFAKEMMMEKFEVKQEYKNTEGDPLIKSKRKEVAREIAYQEGPAGGVRRAKAVVTNPTHLAIAIGYDKEVDAAPYILAMGNDNNAEAIIKLAERYNVPVLRNIPLAHNLWEHGELYDYVPEDTYEALAEILRWIASLESGAALAEMPNGVG